jgi:bifunctional DNA-binding transcriptional regulator/antitoxin component of YhaV-PrlF toxin-antitoxin module
MPKAVRDRLGLATGSRIDFIEDENGYRIVANRASVSGLYGILPKPDRPLTLEEMEAGIALGAAESMK